MSYIKEATKRGLIGILSASFLSYTLILFASLKSDSITIQSSDLMFHYLAYAIGGFYFSGISIVFNVDEWSLLRQFVTHVCLTLPFLPIAHFIGFMPSTFFGRSLFIGFYLSGYIVSFIIYLFHLRSQTKKINAAL